MTPNCTLYRFQYDEYGTLYRDVLPAERRETFVGAFYIIKPYEVESPLVPLQIAQADLGQPGCPFYNSQEQKFYWGKNRDDAKNLCILSENDDSGAAGQTLLYALREWKSRLDAKAAFVESVIEAVTSNSFSKREESQP